MSTVVVRPLAPGDAERVLAIYQAGIDTGNASFDTVAPSWDEWDSGHLTGHRFVAVDSAAGVVLGWVALSSVSGRCFFAGVVEDSVYIDPAAAGRGVGSALLRAVIESAEAGGIWTLQAMIFPENEASLALHSRAGFRLVGIRERIGCHQGIWRDVALLERRSASVA